MVGFAGLVWVARELRLAPRRWRRDGGVAVAVVAILALGFGAVLTVNGFVEALLAGALPFPDRERTVQIWARDPARPGMRDPLAGDELERLAAGVGGLEIVTGFATGEVNEIDPAGTRRLPVLWGAPGLLEFLQLNPVQGRLPSAQSEPSAPPEILATAAYRSRATGDAPVGAGPLLLDGQPFTIVGVVPSALRGPTGEVALVLPEPDLLAGERAFTVLGRLAPGAGLQALRVELESRALSVLGGARQLEVARIDEAVVDSGDRLAVRLLYGAALGVWLLATANVAGLLAARRLSRQPDDLIRRALGATPARLVGAELADLVWVAAGAATVATLVSSQSARMLLTLLPGAAVAGPSSLSSGSIGRSGLLIGATAAACLLPVLVRLVRGSAGGAGSGAARVRRMRGLVVLQLAVATVSMATAGLLGQALTQALGSETGFAIQGLWAAQVRLAPSAPAPAETLERIRADLAAQPWSGGATLAARPPFRGRQASLTVEAEVPGSRPDGVAVAPEAVPAVLRRVGPGYAELVGLERVAGEALPADPTAATHVAQVNATLAARLWPAGWRPDSSITAVRPGGEREPLLVIGVVSDERRIHPAFAPAPAVYVHRGRSQEREATLLLRPSAGVVAGLERELQALVARVDRTAAADRMTSVVALRDQLLAVPRTLIGLLRVLAGAAVLMGLGGTYAAVRQLAISRTREIGIRLALGASPRHTATLVLGRAAWIAGLSLATGGLGAMLVGQLLTGSLSGVPEMGPGLLVPIGATILAGVLAVALPSSLSAARIHPARALRAE